MLYTVKVGDGFYTESLLITSDASMATRVKNVVKKMRPDYKVSVSISIKENDEDKEKIATYIYTENFSYDFVKKLTSKLEL